MWRPHVPRVSRLILCTVLTLVPTLQAQVAESPLLGTWAGTVHHGNETKQFGLRFALIKNDRLAVFFNLPDLRFHDYGPIPVKKEGDDYSAVILFFKLSADGYSLTGKWSFDGNDLPVEAQRGPIPAALPAPVVSAPISKPTWSFKTGAPIWSSPAFGGDAVYCGSSDGSLYALHASSGKLLWQFKTGAAVVGAPTLDGDFVYVLSDDGYLYKLGRRDAKVVWKFDTHGQGVAREGPNVKSDVYDTEASAPTIAGGIVYIGSADKGLYAVNAESGRGVWHFETQGLVRSTPAVDAGRVFFGSRDHFIYALDARTGALRWKFDTLREVVSSPLVAGNTVYIGSRSSNLYALDAANGEVKWKFFYWSSWVESSARILGGVLYIGSSDSQQLYAIDPASGKLLWSFGTDGSPWTTPAVTEDRVYIGAAGVPNYFIPHHGGFFAVDRATGKAVWRYSMPEIPGADTYGVASSPAVGRGLVYFGGLDGVVYAFAR